MMIVFWIFLSIVSTLLMVVGLIVVLYAVTTAIIKTSINLIGYIFYRTYDYFTVVQSTRGFVSKEQHEKQEKEHKKKRDQQKREEQLHLGLELFTQGLKHKFPNMDPVLLEEITQTLLISTRKNALKYYTDLARESHLRTNNNGSLYTKVYWRNEMADRRTSSISFSSPYTFKVYELNEEEYVLLIEHDITKQTYLFQTVNWYLIHRFIQKIKEDDYILH